MSMFRDDRIAFVALSILSMLEHSIYGREQSIFLDDLVSFCFILFCIHKTLKATGLSRKID